MRRFVLLIALALPSHAADTAQVLTWKACLREAAQRNPSLLAARESLIQARAATQSAIGALRPTLEAGAGASYGESRTAGRTEGNDAWSADLSSSYTLADGGANKARVEAARLKQVQSRIDLTKESARVGAELARAFTRLAFAQQQVVLLENIADRRLQNRDLVQLRYEGGKENLGSTLRSSAVYQQALQDATSALRSMNVTRRELAVALGRAESDELYVDDYAPEPEVPAKPDLPALLASTPEVLRAVADRAIARANVVIAHSAFRPDWSLNLSTGRSGDDPELDSSSWRAGIRVAYPIYRGRRDTLELISAQAAEREAGLRLEQTRQASQLDLEKAWADARDAHEQQAVQQAFLDAAEVRSEIARSQYASGLIGFQDWDQIEDEVISARKSLLATRRDATLAAAEWLRVQGRSPLEVP